MGRSPLAVLLVLGGAACSSERAGDAGSNEDVGLFDAGALDAEPGDVGRADVGAWDAGELGEWHLPPGSSVTLAPRAADLTISGTYTEPNGFGEVAFHVRAFGPESAEAAYETADLRLTVHVTDARHGYVVVNDEDDLTLDGYGTPSTLENAYMFALLLPPISYAVAGVPLELGCSTGFLPVELQALLLPWQLRLKYAQEDRSEQILMAADAGSCAYFPPLGSEIERPLPPREYLQLGYSTPIPSVFGFFPFDEEGAFEVPTSKGSGGYACVLPNSADDSARGACGTMCNGSCAGYCSPLHCEKTEVYPPDCCSTPAGTAIPYSSIRVIYTCRMDANCKDLDDCYEQCNYSKKCGTWAAFKCRHDVGDASSCDRKVCDGRRADCLRWMSGTGPFTSTKTYKYHQEPADDPRCAPSCVPAGTSVQTASGDEVPIERIEVGAKIRAIDLESGESGVATVEQVLVHEDGPFALDLLVPAEGDDLLVTPNHPIWTVDGGFLPASELRPGDLLLRVDVATGVPEAVLLVSIVRAVAETNVVYNLKTTRGQYVADDLVVHNKCVAAGTLIDRPGGTTPIEDLRPGDLVFGTIDGERRPTRVLRVFEKATVLPSLPAKRLGPALVVTVNHVVATDAGDVPATALFAPDAEARGPVYDLETESGDYLASGVRLRAAR